jgi:hypothetical protein
VCDVFFKVDKVDPFASIGIDISEEPGFNRGHFHIVADIRGIIVSAAGIYRLVYAFAKLIYRIACGNGVIGKVKARIGEDTPLLKHLIVVEENIEAVIECRLKIGIAGKNIKRIIVFLHRLYLLDGRLLCTSVVT